MSSSSPSWKNIAAPGTPPVTRCLKLIINGNSVNNVKYHRNIAQQPIKFKVSMKIAIDDRVAINGRLKF